MFKSSITKITLRLAVFVLFAAILVISAPQAKAQVFKDPLLEYSYHVKVDLAWIQGFVDRMFNFPGQDQETKDEMKEIMDRLMQIGLFDMQDAAFDCRLEGDRFTGSAKLMLNTTSSRNSMIRQALAIQPRASVVRALIPEEKTLAWLTVTDPAAMLDLMQKNSDMMMECCEGREMTDEEEGKNCLKEGPVADMVNLLKGVMGDELHVVLFDLAGWTEIYPEPYFAIIMDMGDGVKPNDLLAVKDAFKKLFVETFKGEMTVSDWNGYEVRTFKNFGCPLSITPSLIVDKNYMIFATYPKTLEETAGYVLTPTRTGQAQQMMPVVMNGMFTINIDKLVKILPTDAISSIIPPESENLKSIANSMKEENWGSLVVKRTHIPNGVLGECSMDRSLCSFLFTLWQETMIYLQQDSMKYKMESKKDSSDEEMGEDENDGEGENENDEGAEDSD